MRSPLSSQCPNCEAQIVLYDWGFRCSVCDYDQAQYVAFLTHDVEFPGLADSPALVKP